MSTVPAFLGVITPVDEFIVATEVSPDDQVTVPPPVFPVTVGVPELVPYVMVVYVKFGLIDLRDTVMVAVAQSLAVI